MKTKFLIGAALVSLCSTASLQAVAADKLTYYCSAQEDWCQLMATGFEEATGIKVNMTRKSSGETLAQIKAESDNPKGDIWWGGTGDPHLQAAEEGLTELVGLRFTPESWEAMTGTRPIEDGISEKFNSQWISKDGVSIEDGWVDYIGEENYTMQDVIDFIKRYPNATKVKELTGGRETSDLNTLIALKQKFEKITGIKATPSNVTEVLNVDPNQAPLDAIKENLDIALS